MRNEKSTSDIDWQLATWEGATREAMRRWAALPLERIIAAQEEMQELAAQFARPAGEGRLQHDNNPAGNPENER